MLSNFLSKFIKKDENQKIVVIETKNEQKKKVQPKRIGELGEYKINIQLDQLQKEFMYISDLLIKNINSKTGYSQIDHIVFTPLAIFVIETKNYQGTIYGNREKEKWSVNGKFPMMNPFHQNFGHIKAIKYHLSSTDISSFVSIVSFSRRCVFKVNEELRKIHSNDLIIYDTELSDIIKRKLNVLNLQPQRKRFSEDELKSMYNHLKEINITDNSIREKHIELINKAKTETNSSAKCAVCGKTLSEKVKTYCISNKEKFKGQIFCFEHQK